MKPMSSKYKERKQYQSLGGMRSLIYKQVKQQVANKTKRTPNSLKEVLLSATDPQTGNYERH